MASACTPEGSTSANPAGCAGVTRSSARARKLAICARVTGLPGQYRSDGSDVQPTVISCWNIQATAAS